MLSVLIFYLLGINLFAAGITVWDKQAAKKHRRRVPEATLLGTGALGGALLMLITMKLIRHKTRKKKFMIGLPLLLFLQIALAVTAGLLSAGKITI